MITKGLWGLTRALYSNSTGQEISYPVNTMIIAMHKR